MSMLLVLYWLQVAALSTVPRRRMARTHYLGQMAQGLQESSRLFPNQTFSEMLKYKAVIRPEVAQRP